MLLFELTCAQKKGIDPEHAQPVLYLCLLSAYIKFLAPIADTLETLNKA